MKFRIKNKKNGMYYEAEYKGWLFWCPVPNSKSCDIEETREACERFKNKGFEQDEIVKVFEL